MEGISCIPKGERGVSPLSADLPFDLSGFNTLSCIFRLLLSALLGGAIGGERERHGRAAGLRTHIMVCLGSTITVIAGLYVSYELGFSNDPLRAGAQVISGIGFLGVGTILMRNGSHVVGLTTAAGLWTTAAIGLMVGTGYYSISIVAALLVIVAMVFLGRKEETKRRRKRERSFYLEMLESAPVQALIDAMSTHRIEILPARSGLAGRLGIRITVDSQDISFVKEEPSIEDTLRGWEGVVLLLPDDDPY